MPQQLLDGDLVAAGEQPGQQLLDGLVEPQPVLLDQAQHGRGDHRLGDAGDREAVLGRQPHAGPLVGGAGDDHPALVADADRDRQPGTDPPATAPSASSCTAAKTLDVRSAPVGASCGSAGAATGMPLHAVSAASAHSRTAPRRAPAVRRRAIDSSRRQCGRARGRRA